MYMIYYISPFKYDIYSETLHIRIILIGLRSKKMFYLVMTIRVYILVYYVY